MNIAERRFTTSLSKSVIILVLSHCFIDDFYFYVIESVVLHGSLLAVPNTFMSFSPSLAEPQAAMLHSLRSVREPIEGSRSCQPFTVTLEFSGK